MQSLICQQCHASLNWDGQSEIVRCEYCGTRYRMHPRQRQSGSGVRVGLGEVSEVQTTQGRYAGHALVRSFIPKGWSVQTNAPEQESNVLCPLTIRVEYTAPAGDAVITFTGTRAFHHLEPTPQTMQMQGRMGMPERIIGLAYRDAGAVCDGVLQGNPAIKDLRLRGTETQPDAWASAHMQKNMQEFAAAGTLNPGGTWARKTASVRDQNGNAWRKQIEAMVLYAYIPLSQGEQMAWQMVQQSRARLMGTSASMAMRGMLGGLLANMATPQLQAPQPKLRWTVQYMVETSVKEGSSEPAEDYARKIRDTIEVLPLMEQEIARLREQLMMQVYRDDAALGDAMAQANREQMASWDRRQQIIQGASDYGSNVMHEMQRSNAATMDRVNNLRSESIRGVNTYYTQSPGFGVPDVVEAGVGWDHVYQNTQYPDVFAASTGEAPLEFGVDFEELKQTGGDY